MTDTSGTPTWRDIISELTPDQIDELELFEQMDFEPDQIQKKSVHVISMQ
jgi:hypothetical protein